jgi:hypothetical protein
MIMGRERKCADNVALMRGRVTIVVVEKWMIITYSECVFVVLVIQHAKRVHRILFPSVACLVLLNFWR